MAIRHESTSSAARKLTRPEVSGSRSWCGSATLTANEGRNRMPARIDCMMPASNQRAPRMMPVAAAELVILGWPEVSARSTSSGATAARKRATYESGMPATSRSCRWPMVSRSMPQAPDSSATVRNAAVPMIPTGHATRRSTRPFTPAPPRAAPPAPRAAALRAWTPPPPSQPARYTMNRPTPARRRRRFPVARPAPAARLSR